MYKFTILEKGSRAVSCKEFSKNKEPPGLNRVRGDGSFCEDPCALRSADLLSGPVSYASCPECLLELELVVKAGVVAPTPVGAELVQVYPINIAREASAIPQFRPDVFRKFPFQWVLLERLEELLEAPRERDDVFVCAILEVDAHEHESLDRRLHPPFSRADVECEEQRDWHDALPI